MRPQGLVGYREAALNVNGAHCMVRWYIADDHTICSVFAAGRGRRLDFFGGLATRKPGDEFDAMEAMKASARRACGIGVPGAEKTYALYGTIREWLCAETKHTPDSELMDAMQGSPVPEPVMTMPRA